MNICLVLPLFSLPSGRKIAAGILLSETVNKEWMNPVDIGVECSESGLEPGATIYLVILGRSPPRSVENPRKQSVFWFTDNSSVSYLSVPSCLQTTKGEKGRRKRQLPEMQTEGSGLSLLELSLVAPIWLQHGGDSLGASL